MTEPSTQTARLSRALVYANQVHAGQYRKGTTIPYISHLLAVTATVLEYGGDQDLAIAALLHDSAEDQGGLARLEDIRNYFGTRVARIVEACSDSLADTSKGETKRPWLERKTAYLEHLETAEPDVLLVSLADKVHNARSILRDLRGEAGERVWERFSQSRDMTIWSYSALASVFMRRMPGQLAEELAEIVQTFGVAVSQRGADATSGSFGPPLSSPRTGNPA